MVGQFTMPEVTSSILFIKQYLKSYFWFQKTVWCCFLEECAGSEALAGASILFPLLIICLLSIIELRNVAYISLQVWRFFGAVDLTEIWVVPLTEATCWTLFITAYVRVRFSFWILLNDFPARNVLEPVAFHGVLHSHDALSLQGATTSILFITRYMENCEPFQNTIGRCCLQMCAPDPGPHLGSELPSCSLHDIWSPTWHSRTQLNGVFFKTLGSLVISSWVHSSLEEQYLPFTFS